MRMPRRTVPAEPTPEITPATAVATTVGCPDGAVTLECAGCDWQVAVATTAVSFKCPSCKVNNFICACSRCGSPSCVPSRTEFPPARWECWWCSGTSSLPILGCLPVRSAHHVARTRVARGVGHLAPTATAVVGLTVEASTITWLAPGSWCDLRVHGDALELVSGDTVATARFPLTALDQFEVSGRDRDDSGARAARRGPRPAIDAVVRLAAGDQRVVLRHPSRSRDELQTRLATALQTWDNACRRTVAMTFETALETLEQLLELHRVGAISTAQLNRLRTACEERLGALTVAVTADNAALAAA